MKLIALVIVLCAHQAFAKKLPPTFSICSRNDPQLDECFSKATQKALSLILQPIPELSLPGIDPMKFDKIEVPPSNSDNFKFRQKLTNLELQNLKETQVIKSRLNLGAKDFNVVIYTNTPWLKLSGNYEIDGKILLLVIKGAGTFNVTFDNVSVEMDMSGKIIEKKGQQHLQLETVSFKMNPKNLIFKFDNLFNGNEDLGDSMNRLLNENWKPIYAEIGYVYEGVVAVYLKNYATQIFNKVPYDELFPIKYKFSQIERSYENFRPEYKHYFRRGDFDSLLKLLEMCSQFETLPPISKPALPEEKVLVVEVPSKRHKQLKVNTKIK